MNPVISLQQSEQRFRLLVEAVHDYAIYILDLEGRVATWNIGAERIKGYTSSEVMGKHYSCFYTPEDVACQVPLKILRTAERTGHFVGEGWRICKDKSRFWASVIVTPIRDEHGQLLGYAKITRDLTETKRQQDALIASEARLYLEKNRLQLTLDSIADGVVSSDAVGRVTLLNPAAEAMTGWSFDAACGQPIAQVVQLVAGESGIRIEDPVAASRAGKRILNTKDSLAILGRDGIRRDIQDSVAPMLDPDGEIQGSVLVLQDVTELHGVAELQAALKEMEFNAHHDPLTSLPNRRRFKRELELLLREIHDGSSEHAVCFLDLDQFKVVNDTAGHAAGDMLLVSVAQLLGRFLSPPDLAARLGGDEFAIIFRNRSVDEVSSLLAKLSAEFAAFTFPWENRVYQVSASIGVTLAATELDAATVMKQADIACYASKRSGGNRVTLYLPDRHGSSGQTDESIDFSRSAQLSE